MKLTNILPVVFALFLFNCGNQQITDKAEYNTYLETNQKNNYSQDLEFWNAKLDTNPDNFMWLTKRAGSYNTAFKATGDIAYLIKAETDLVKANNLTKYNNASLLRTLASNYISQHRFKEALSLLELAKTNGEKLEATKKMLFDVHLELGNYIYAKSYLDEFKNTADFDYLIRLSKWQDHQGNLEGAIESMEKATAIAKASNLNSIKQWAYTNLADFYGHAGNIEASYKHYLKALELDPNDAYAKKGIAWITYSYEKNPEEALRILDHISSYYQAPDYDLLKAEIAEFTDNSQLKNKALSNYNTAMQNEQFGEMYNKYNIMLFAEELNQSIKAIAIAKREVENRPTPGSYDLLAWSYFNNGQIDKAVAIVKEHVDGFTYEPEVLYHIAEIYKAAGYADDVKPIKSELLASSYELGPVMTEKIKQL
ncbi:MAG: cell surface protein [Winogradskyella sp.]|nr:cell surface protein [Winogradskyella sp.]